MVTQAAQPPPGQEKHRQCVGGQFEGIDQNEKRQVQYAYPLESQRCRGIDKCCPHSYQRRGQRILASIKGEDERLIHCCEEKSRQGAFQGFGHCDRI